MEMTPMIDVTFLLLIFFLCTIKFKTLEGKLSAYLPEGRGREHQPRAEPKEKVEIRDARWCKRGRASATPTTPRSRGAGKGRYEYIGREQAYVPRRPAQGGQPRTTWASGSPRPVPARTPKRPATIARLSRARSTATSSRCSTRRSRRASTDITFIGEYARAAEEVARHVGRTRVAVRVRGPTGRHGEETPGGLRFRRARARSLSHSPARLVRFWTRPLGTNRRRCQGALPLRNRRREVASKHPKSLP